MTHLATTGTPRPGPLRLRAALVALLLVAGVLSVATGAAGVSLLQVLGDALSGNGISARDKVVLLDIRLPRLVMGVMVGAGLAVAGAVMQGLFRNPLADPGIIGVGAGAGLGAVAAIVLGGMLPGALTVLLGQHLVPVAAFLGAWAATLLLYRVASRGGRTSVATLLLAGIALAAMAGALTGVLTYLADDRQLRDLTFWGMGSLAGASWPKLATGAALIVPALALAPRLARGLNALALGEAAAAHMGTDVERLKRHAVLVVAALAGASVALAGGIGFVGIVVPHLLRLAAGPDHRALLPNAALMGATLLVLADLIARLVVAPAELPIGIVTAVIGAPVFLWILLRRRGFGGL
ncbi:iron ABC transporter permease [Paenirhodobacter sp. CAU 1674]|uniref:FecCD family ABC transporter permease n=1 Tax=Paenirhodobacter sp. CAU 1674 TaxID=3032596 RepID=UPI0023DA1C02|nr:iron ABC transporter permease [Paenirhodobacter sp. CAU 1674]MDF2141331.1 iron ABC transporter permease [Paenirhodobacter sp. CAU 1674]